MQAARDYVEPGAVFSSQNRHFCQYFNIIELLDSLAAAVAAAAALVAFQTVAEQIIGRPCIDCMLHAWCRLSYHCCIVLSTGPPPCDHRSGCPAG